MNVQTILHPTDHSEASRAALRFAVALAHDYQARLLILHVVPPGGLTGPVAAAPEESLASGRVSMEYLMGEGEPVTTILETAARHKCDLIVLGRDGASGWQSWFKGTRTEQIVRLALCPVLVVKEAMSPHVGPVPATPGGRVPGTLPVPAGR